MRKRNPAVKHLSCSVADFSAPGEKLQAVQCVNADLN